MFIRRLIGSAGAAALLLGAFWAGRRTSGDVSHAAAKTAEAGAQHAHHHGGMTDDAPAGAAPEVIEVPAEVRQMLGVQSVPVEKKSGAYMLGFIGRVLPDETRTFRINAGVSGAIHDVSGVTTGSRVKKNQVLGSFVAPEALPALQLYILNRASLSRVSGSAAEGKNAAELAAANLRQRLDQLEAIGVSMDQLREIGAAGIYPASIRIVSPADGVVLSRSVTPGMKFEKGMEFFRIADLRKVWISADIFEHEARMITPGLRAEVTLPGASRKYSAVVLDAVPQFDAASRTVKVRLEADNADGGLIPNRIVSLAFSIAYPPAIVLPADSVIQSGAMKTVFVEVSAGRFKPQTVETGWQAGNQIEIVSGLAAQSRVARSGTFLLESEARMKRIGVAAQQGSGAAHPPGHEGHHGAHSSHGHQ